MKMAIIGCGGIGNSHMQCVGFVEEDQLVAVVDTDASNLKTAAEKYGCLAFNSDGEMLEKVKPDGELPYMNFIDDKGGYVQNLK